MTSWEVRKAEFNTSILGVNIVLVRRDYHIVVSNNLTSQWFRTIKVCYSSQKKKKKKENRSIHPCHLRHLNQNRGLMCYS